MNSTANTTRFPPSHHRLLAPTAIITINTSDALETWQVLDKPEGSKVLCAQDIDV